MREFSRFNFYRSIEGADSFMGKAGYWAQTIFGTKESGPVISVSDEEAGSEDTHFGIPYNRLVSLARPRVKVFDPDDLILTMLQRRMPRDMNENFGYVFSKLMLRSVKQGRTQARAESSVRAGTLFSGLSQIGYKYDIPQQDSVPIVCDSLQVVSDIDSPESIVLSLGLDFTHPATAMLSEQINFTTTYLMNLRGGKKAAFPYTPTPIAIPFAVLPPDATLNEKKDFDHELSDLLPVRLIMGGFEHSSLY